MKHFLLQRHNLSENKAHERNRKSKKGGLLAGLAIAGTIVTVHNNATVSAEEVSGTNQNNATTTTAPTSSTIVTENSATNLKEPQPAPSTANTSFQSTSGQKTGNITTQIQSPELNSAVNTAKSNGVEVGQKPSVVVNSAEVAKSDLNNQTTKVNGAATTQKEVNATLKKATESANQAGVKLSEKPTVTYKDNDDQAKKDAQEQSSHLNNLAKVQTQATESLAKEIKKASDVGVHTFENPEAKTFTNPQEALEYLNKQILDLQKAVKVNEQIKSIISEAEAQAKKSGIRLVNTVQKSHGNDLSAALADAQEQASKISKAIAAQTQANKAILDAKSLAEKNKTVVKSDGRITVSPADAKSTSEKIVQAINEIVAKNKVIVEENANKQALYEKSLKELQDKNKLIAASNVKKQEQYNADLVKYNEEMAKLKANVSHDGYLSKFVSQSLKFDSEPNANLSLSGNFKYVDPSKPINNFNSNDAQSKSITTAFSSELNSDPKKTVVWHGSDDIISKPISLEAGKSVTATYTNLKNSTYAGQPISKVVIKYTNVNKTDKELMFVAQDPTNGFIVYSRGLESSKVKTDIQYFDNKGSLIKFTEANPAIIALSSLNSQVETKGVSTNGKGEHLPQEVVKDYNFKFIKITGSSVDEHKDGIYSDQNNDYTEKGSKYNNSAWDQSNNPLFYYGSGAGVVSSGDTISFTSENRRTSVKPWERGQWLAISSKIAAPTAKKPSLPTLDQESPNKLTPPPLNPLLEAKYKEVVVEEKYHKVGILPEARNIQLLSDTHKVVVATSVHPVLVTQAPINHKGVYSLEKVSIDGQKVPKGSEVSWVLENSPLKAGRQYTLSYRLSDPLPEGYKINIAKTVAASPGWEVVKDKDGSYSLSLSKKEQERSNSNLLAEYIVPKATIFGEVTNDSATYKNIFKTTIVSAETVIVGKDGKVVPKGTPTTYTVTSNIPVVYTPVSAKPEKHIYTATGQRIDGKTILPNSKVHYTLKIENQQFKGIKASNKDIEKGFVTIDDIQDNTVGLDVKNAVYELADGTKVNDVTLTRYKSLSEAPKELQQIIKNAGQKPQGEFLAITPKNNDFVSYYNKYILTGTNIFVSLPVITGNYTGTFTNKVSMIAFGNGYDGNIVQNDIPKLEAIKDIKASITSKESLNHKNIALHQVFPYELDLPAVSANIAGGIYKLSVRDDFDESHDKYDGKFYFFADKEFKTKSGKVFKVNAELTQYVTQNIIRDKTGRAIAVEFSFDKDFLQSIDKDSVLDVRGYMFVERIAYGKHIKNTFTTTLNDYSFDSTTVESNTLEPTPTPTPVAPKQVVSKPLAKASVLPQTGDNKAASLSAVGMVLLTSVLGLTFKSKKKS